MSNSEKKVMLMKKLQEELDRRAEIEEVAIDLIADGKYEIAIKLLDSIDDNIVKEITDKLDELEKTKNETETVDQEKEEPKLVKAVDILNDLEELQEKVIYSDTFFDIPKEDQERIYTYCLAHSTNEVVKRNLSQIRYAVTKRYFGF